ncbi:MAG TPA: hypothetical protein VF810_04465 [Patescibacteria group bacterium]
MIFTGTFFAELLLLFLFSRMVTRKLSSIIYQVSKSQKLTIYFMAFLFFPGTILHELAHLIMAGILFVPVGQIDLWPKLEEDGIKLGSVAIAETDIFRRFVVGAAPFLFGVALLLAILYFGVSNNLLSNQIFIIIMLYLTFEIGNTMFSSKKDMEGALELFGGILFVLLVFYFLGVRIPSFNPQLILENKTVVQIVKQGSIFLLVPLGVDLLVLILLRLTSFKRLPQ